MQSMRVHSCGGSRATPLRRQTLRVSAASGKVNVLVVGGGGREHSLAWKLSQSPLCSHLYCAPGNPGTETEPNVTNVSINVTKHQDVVNFCREKRVGLVVVGPEVPLVAGLADDLQAAGVPTWGPSAKAAQLEGSKVFMKDICRKYNIPTAGYDSFTDAGRAKAFIKSLGAPIVVKASGLAAGKGVVVARTVEEAYKAVDDMLVNKMFGGAGDELVIEEFMDGEEVSFFALVDGEAVIPLVSAQDHKAVGDGDTGPNTGGMGAYSPAPRAVMNDTIFKQVMDDIIYRTAHGMAAEGMPFRGTLFAGLMIKDGKAKLLEHNVRFGDPECQGLMARCDSDLTEAMLRATTGRLQDVELLWKPESALTVVMAAKGYPGAYSSGSVIRGFENVTSAKVFHAGTARNAAGEVVSNGGRVLNITALGKDVAEAQAKAYEAVKQIEWADAYYRSDIGWRAIARL
ncbi:Phosphoribosylamine--glycine ligase, chloroplastic [Tetrabaena socialis]|uniref:phosphoribosylamine--glycine ligase n=1 Tax=Tetrabaena socialis TaxID=47790 RepID=A0A2J8A8I2_9CHLO|nr:Phosphoribosylamine--glycine ligase, chloroplastic [Tetrabaena socialis]|eukprot:PNH08815.1 Phosphoribosylamine--glycine ligase, chloroplastic [Tetrabaena socialis]